MAESPREFLFDRIRAGIEYGMQHYAGTDSYGDRARDGEAWRSAQLPALLDAVMVHLRAGIGPHLSRQAIADGAEAARTLLRVEYTKHGIAHCPECVWTGGRHSDACRSRAATLPVEATR